MEALLKDLLACRDGGFGVGETEPVSLGDRTRRCWNAVAPPDAELVVGSSRELEADPDRLEQLLQNLFGNAVEHARPRGDEGTGVTVTVGVLRSKDGFFVQDDGPGVTAVEGDSPFEAGVSTAEAVAGLGLAIVEDVVEAHGWRLDVTESRTSGAWFEISRVDPAVCPPPRR